MSLSDLRKLDLLRPETQWKGHVPRSPVSAFKAGCTAAIGLGSCVLMAIGDGGWMTWLGAAAFGVALGAFTLVNMQAIGGKRREDQPVQREPQSVD